MPGLAWHACLIGILVFFLSPVFGDAWEIKDPSWTPEDEKAYSTFVESLGQSEQDSLTKFLRDPNQNPLYTSEDQKIDFVLTPDCADLPYFLRAYVAFKRKKPFLFSREMSAPPGSGTGDPTPIADPRYSDGNRPSKFGTSKDFSTPRDLFNALSDVNSGFFRTAPESQDSDFYPVKLQKPSIGPGTIFYDPSGHVAVAYHVASDGRIQLLDAHPDKSFSRTEFGPKFDRGEKPQGGGFKRWRPPAKKPTPPEKASPPGSPAKPERERNENLPDYSDSEQYQKEYEFKGKKGLSYYDYVRASLSEKGTRIDPKEELKKDIQSLFQDLQSRQIAVDLAQKAGIHKKPHPGVLPPNIYGAHGEWELYSTPSRDARLKASFRNLYDKTGHLIRMAETDDMDLEYPDSPKDLARDLLDIYQKETSQRKISYENSNGKKQELSLNDVHKRLFDLSFDPYHPPEYRWGATGSEAAAVPPDPLKKSMYEKEARLRNQIERVPDRPTGLDFGPPVASDTNIAGLLNGYLEQPSEESLINRFASRFGLGRTRFWRVKLENTMSEYLPNDLPIPGWSLALLLLGVALLARSQSETAKKIRAIDFPGKSQLLKQAQGARDFLDRQAAKTGKIREFLEKMKEGMKNWLGKKKESEEKTSSNPSESTVERRTPGSPISNETSPTLKTPESERKKASDPDFPQDEEAAPAPADANEETTQQKPAAKTIKLFFHLDETKSLQAGFSVENLIRTLRDRFGTQRNFGLTQAEKVITVTFKSSLYGRKELAQIKALPVYSPSRGASIPLGQLANITLKKS